MGQCTATSKRTGQRCKQMCAPGKTVCKWHGGASTGPAKGSKNALKHGLHERIVRETLMDGEDEYIASINFENPVSLLMEQIRMLKVKEWRIVRRMKAVLEAELKANGANSDEKKQTGLVKLKTSVAQKINPDGTKGTEIFSESETHVMFYLRLEAAHTKVGEQIRKAMATLAQMQAELGVTNEPLPLYTCPPDDLGEPE